MYNIDNIASNSFGCREVAADVVRGVLESVNVILSNQGLPPILVYNDPAGEVSDTYGYIFTTDELSDEEVKEASKDIWGETYNDDPEMDEFDEPEDNFIDED